MFSVANYVMNDSSIKRNANIHASSFRCVTIEFIRNYLSWFKHFPANCVLSVGYNDQTFVERFDASRSLSHLREVVMHMIGHGVDHLLLVMPPPHPNVSNDSLVVWRWYEQLLQLYRELEESYPKKIKILDFTRMVAKYRYAHGRVLAETEGKCVFNLNLLLRAFTISGKYWASLATTVAAKLALLIKSTFQSMLRNATRIDLSDESSRCTALSVVQDNLDWFSKIDLSRFKTLKSGVIWITVSFGADFIFEVLVDTGATRSFISGHLLEKLLVKCPNNVVLLSLNCPIRITLGVGEIKEISRTAACYLLLGNTIPTKHPFIEVPGLNDLLIFGGDFLSFYRAILDVGRGLLTLQPDTTHQASVKVRFGLVNERTRRFMDEVRRIDISLKETRLEFDNESNSAHCVRRMDESDSERVKYGAWLRCQLQEAIDRGALTPQQADEACLRLERFGFVFRDQLGRFNGYKISLPISITETWSAKRYHIPANHRTAVAEEIKRMLDAGIIIRSNTRYVHPLVVVPKNDGSIRLCIDASALNKILLKQINEPPRIEDVLFAESQGSFLSSFDFAKGFLQIELSEETSTFLGFEVDGQTYQFCRLPFGTAVSSAVFNTVVKSVVFQDGDLRKDVTLYVDDLKVQTESFESHLSTLERILSNIERAGMTLSISKSGLFRDRILYLGHWIHGDMISKNKAKMTFFEKFEARYFKNETLTIPNKKCLQSLLGFANWFGRFVFDFGGLTKPFLDLLKDGPPFRVDGSIMNHYVKLKQSIMNDESLHNPNFALPFLVYFVVSEQLLSGVIFQRVEGGKINIISMVNHKITVEMTSKPDVARQFYALYFILRRFRQLLFGKVILVDRRLKGYVDTIASLVREISSMWAKWFIYVNEFDVRYEAEYDGEFSRIIDLCSAPVTDNSVIPELPTLKQCFEYIVSDSNVSDELAYAEHEDLMPPCVEIGDRICVECECFAAKVFNAADVEIENFAYDLFKHIAQHQRVDAHCSEIIARINEGGEVANYELIDDVLHFAGDEGTLIVLPQHAVVDTIKFFHVAYCHSGVEKTHKVVTRHFYFNGLVKTIRRVVGDCIICKQNKIGNAKPKPEIAHVRAFSVGEKLSVDVMGPYPLKKGGIVGLFVCLDVFSGFAFVIPVRSISAPTLIKAFEHVVNWFRHSAYRIQAVVSDNAASFRSGLWREFLFSNNIKTIAISPYSPSANVVERYNRSIGEKLRIRINSNLPEHSDHRKWYREIDYINKILNSTPLFHGFTPNEIVGAEESNPLDRFKIARRVPDPISLLNRMKQQATLSIQSYKPRLTKNTSQATFTYTSEGEVRIWCDACVQQNGTGRMISSVARFFQQDHALNRAVVVVPPLTNNQGEIFAVIWAIETASQQLIEKVRIITDSEYVSEFFNNHIAENNDDTSLDKIKNTEMMTLLFETAKNFGLERLKITHTHGHMVDFGNLEVDYLARTCLNEYKQIVRVIDNATTSSKTELIGEVVNLMTSRKLEIADHRKATSHMGVTEFKNGEVVSLRNHSISNAAYGITKKFLPRYLGFFRVLAKVGPNAYEVADENRPGRRIVVNVRQMVRVSGGS